jgi:NADH-quinone oxidoreductase subunit J
MEHLVSGLIVGSSLCVVVVQSPMISVLFLILTFFNTTILLFWLGCEFLAFVFIIIYLGAIAVLFLFVVMMLNVETLEKTKFVKTDWIKILLTMGLFGIFYKLMYSFIENIHYFDEKVIWGWQKSEKDLLEQLLYKNELKVIGNFLYTSYFLVFFVAGMILLTALIGAIVLTLDCRNQEKLKLQKKQDIGLQISRKGIMFNRTN